MATTTYSAASDALEAGLQRVFQRSGEFPGIEAERQYRQETFECFRQAIALSPTPRDEVLARLWGAVELIGLATLGTDLVTAIRTNGLESNADGYAGVSWFREGVVAARQRAPEFWNTVSADFLASFVKLDIAIALQGDFLIARSGQSGAGIRWWRSFTDPLSDVRQTVLPVTYLKLGNGLFADGESSGARACYERCIDGSHEDEECRRHAADNLRLLDSSAPSAGAASSHAGFHGSWPVLLALAGFSTWNLFGPSPSPLANRVFVAGIFAVAAGGYWYWKSR